MVDLDSLDPETRALAFWLQQHLYEEGVEGIHFMRQARVWATGNAADEVSESIGTELKRL